MNKRRPREMPSQAWDLRGWVALAVGVSVVLHVFLISFMKGYTISWIGKIENFSTALPFKVDRITIDEALLAPDFDEAAAESAFVEEEETTTEADILEIAEAVADRELALTPTVDVPSNLTLSQTPQLSGGPDLSTGLAPDLELPRGIAGDAANALAAVASAALSAMPAMSDDQAIIEIGEDRDVAGVEEAFLKDLVRASDSGDAEETVAGYANLDDLLNYKGPILDTSKPILMPTDLLFGYDEARLQESARLSLMKLGVLIQRNPGATFVIEGHTDTTGPEPYNQQLSERRAVAVKAWLSDSLKIEGGQIQTMGYGETRPIVKPQGSIAEQALNRRVEIKFKPRKKGEPEVRRAEPAC